MLNNMQLKQTYLKLERYIKILNNKRYTKIIDVEVKIFETHKQFNNIPKDTGLYNSIKKGESWGGPKSYAWFCGKLRIPDEYAGKDIFIHPETGGYEGLLWIDGLPKGIFTAHNASPGITLHEYSLFTKNSDPKAEINFAIEFYSGHYFTGIHPFDKNPEKDFIYIYEGISLCLKNQDVIDFIIELNILLQLEENLDKTSFRRAQVIKSLIEVHKCVSYDIDQAREDVFIDGLKKAREKMRVVLDGKNSDSAPLAGITGHSHLDTAWLWPVDETIKKCARTFSNQISLMEQYPEYRFFQSSSYHLELMRLYYPQLFLMIKEKIIEGRYEPNGAAWVECDCNITSGEFMIRQMLWGQRFTKKHFDFVSNCYWLPDTFGYSAAIPQIMKGCNVKYFLTQKLSWNDTNRFPFETFYWEGIDGTKVFAHFHVIHCVPDPKTLINSFNSLQNKITSSKRVIAFGFGDGGGGPQPEMIETVRRLKDLDGCPRTEYSEVGKFMERIEDEAIDVPVYNGELYLEIHRGTLTNMHDIKRNNRKAELMIRDLEYHIVRKAVLEGHSPSNSITSPLIGTILVNQFHDILPGSSIPEVHDQSCLEMTKVLKDGSDEIDRLYPYDKDSTVITVLNTLGFDRREVISIPDRKGLVPEDIDMQRYTDIHGRDMLAIGTLDIPAFGGSIVRFTDQDNKTRSGSHFEYSKNVLKTSSAIIRFAENGTIDSLYDILAKRELRGPGLPLNTFLIAEDTPAKWDGWDIDADTGYKFAPASELIERSVVSDGPLEFRIRSRYRIDERSYITQDMIFYDYTPRIDFDTKIEWDSKHRFLKVDFDTSVKSKTARCEIQFGYANRPTSRNNSIEQAMFEVVNHKYTDVSELRYGAAVLNDCKYGVSVEGSSIRLSLHKGGMNPDPRGDTGTHLCTYSFLPHNSGFSARSVIQPAYCLNVPPKVIYSYVDTAFFMKVDSDNIIIETIKPCEDIKRAYILRIYEAEGCYTNCLLNPGHTPRNVYLTNMLEETIEEIQYDDGIKMTFKPFEIKTIKITF